MEWFYIAFMIAVLAMLVSITADISSINKEVENIGFNTNNQLDLIEGYLSKILIYCRTKDKDDDKKEDEKWVKVGTIENESDDLYEAFVAGYAKGVNKNNNDEILNDIYLAGANDLKERVSYLSQCSPIFLEGVFGEADISGILSKYDVKEILEKKLYMREKS